MPKSLLQKKSRSRSCLRKTRTFATNKSPQKNPLRIRTMNEFLEDKAIKHNKIKLILQPQKSFQEIQLSKRVKFKGKSQQSSNFSRMQTAIEEETQESRQKGEQSDEFEQSDAGHFEFKIGEIIKKKFKIIKHICDGTFGRVLEVQDIKDSKNRHYALKVIRPVERYIEAAKEEANILRKLPENKHIIPLIDTFYYKDHYCILTPIFGQSLAQFLELNDQKGFDISVIQTIAKQLLKTLALIHDLNLTHTDLKPENILFSQKKTRERHLKNSSNKIVLIDFGNATFSNEYHSRIINTREYRAPEVILQCCQWTQISDMWAVGCILCELFNGDCLFQGMRGEGEDDIGIIEHLARIQNIAGNIPSWMAYSAPQKIQEIAIKRNLRNCSNNIQLKMHHFNNNFIKKFLTLEDIIDPFYPEFIDLIKQLLQIDPIQRISAEDALKHPFFEISYD